MTDAGELARLIGAQLTRLAIPASPIVMPTSWAVGPVVAYLFAGDPVTFVDSGVASARSDLKAALRAAGRKPRDVVRVIVTHGHGDHLGGALWLQEESGCEVVLHRTEVELLSRPPGEVLRELFVPLGFDADKLEEYVRRPKRRLPMLTAVDDGATFEAGGRVLRAEHHAGHTPGHLWICDQQTSALFTGDYLLASGPTNPGMMLDPDSAPARVPLLARYIIGLEELRSRRPPALFAGHGLPITDTPTLVDRRISRIARRTRRVLDVLRAHDDATAAELADHLYRGRAHGSFDVVAELVGHLDLLVADGRAATRLGEDGYWHFRASSEGGLHA